MKGKMNKIFKKKQAGKARQCNKKKKKKSKIIQRFITTLNHKIEVCIVTYKLYGVNKVWQTKVNKILQ